MSMMPDTRRLLFFCRAFGYLPFQIDGSDRLSFSWCSKEMGFFFLFFAIGIANISYVYYVFINAIIDLGLEKALIWIPWVSGFSLPVAVQLIMLWRRKELIYFRNSCTELWQIYKLDPQYNINGIMWIIHTIYATFGCLFTIISVSYLNLSQPNFDIFTSSLFCSATNNGTSIECPTAAVIFSTIQHSMWLFYIFLGILIMDLVPMGVAIYMARSFANTNEHLAKQNRNKAALQLAKVVPKSDDPKSEETPQQRALAQIALIRQTMAEHLRIQRCLASFSQTFSPFIMLSVVFLFAMCVILFYKVIKNGVENISEFILYFGTGAQILLRGTMSLHCFGNVREQANDIRDLLHLEVGLLEELRKYDPSILMEVQVFIARLDNVAISAGPYFSCTHSFLMSFYGLLATYVIVLVQTPGK